MQFRAVIPTYNRPDELLNLVKQLHDQNVDDILVISNDGKGLAPGITASCHTFYDHDQSPHIYAMWNFGLAYWFRKGAVAILNDDVVLPDNFVARMWQEMDEHNPTIVFPNQHGHQNHVRRFAPGPTNLTERISGYAFVVNADHGITCDERFKWWYGDDDLDWRARSDYNGTLQVQDVTVQHLYPNQSTVSSLKRQDQAGRDRETFVKKWGKAPW
jgi:glycosyltransferase involved in cell wall biosynthesis